MTKIKSATYDVLSVISMVLSMFAGVAFGWFIFHGGLALLDYLYGSESEISVMISFAIVFIIVTTFIASMIGMSLAANYFINKILKTILHCNIHCCNADDYADGFYVMRRNDRAREDRLESLKECGPVVNKNGSYTVYLGMSYDELDIAIYRMLNKYKSVYYAIPHSHIMPDGVTCLDRPMITLRAAMQAKSKMREDETVFFVYYVDYPGSKSQLAHASECGETVVIDTKDVKGVSR